MNKFRDVLTQGEFDATPNNLTVLRFSQAARQKIAEMKDNDAPDIAILDANMSGNDEAGFIVSEALRKKWPQLPIIYLSEHSGTEIERDALERFSATDFIAKHQRNIEEVLCWRIRSALRQSSISNHAGETSAGDTINSGPLTIDLNSWHVYWYGQRLVNPSNPKRPLAPTPRKILRYLVECSPRPLNTEQMAEKLGSGGEKLTYPAYRQHIKILRHAFGHAQQDVESFMALCKNGSAVATFGDERAYFWKAPSED